MRMSAPKEGSCDPLELPHSLHAFHSASQTDALNKVSNCSVFFVLHYGKVFLCLFGTHV